MDDRDCIACRQWALPRAAQPDGPFDLVLCRNLALTYFDEDLQRAILGHVAVRLRPGGALVVGVHESLPAGTPGFEQFGACRGVFRRVTGGRDGG